VLLYVALAVLFAAPGSRVVLATAGGSPGWLLGPFRSLSAGFADGKLSGPLFYLGLWLALLVYAVVLLAARGIGARLAIGVIAALHLLFLVAPPLLSQDVFSYIAYARLEVVHSLNPYTHSPDSVPGDAVFGFAGSKDATSAYGPLFTIASLPLAKLSVSAAFWILKVLTASATLGIVALAWSCARRLGRDPVFAALAVGLNPLVLVHVVGGAHNDAFAMLAVMGAIWAMLPRERPVTSGALAATAAGIKASGAIAGPFILIGSKRPKEFLAAAAATVAATAIAALAVFGSKALEAFVLIGQNQERTTRWSLPQRAADGISAITGGSESSIVHFTRAGFAALLAVTLLYLLRWAWQRRDDPWSWVLAAGWATFAVLCATAWLVPWYAIWLVPIAAVAQCRWLSAATLALCAYMLVIAVPL